VPETIDVNIDVVRQQRIVVVAERFLEEFFTQSLQCVFRTKK